MDTLHLEVLYVFKDFRYKPRPSLAQETAQIGNPVPWVWFSLSRVLPTCLQSRPAAVDPPLRSGAGVVEDMAGMAVVPPYGVKDPLVLCYLFTVVREAL